MEEEPYTIAESQRAAGVGVDNGPRTSAAIKRGDAMEGLEASNMEATKVVAKTTGVRQMVEGAVGLVGQAMLKMVGAQ